MALQSTEKPAKVVDRSLRRSESSIAAYCPTPLVSIVIHLTSECRASSSSGSAPVNSS